MIIIFQNIQRGYRITSSGLFVPDKFDYSRSSKVELNQLGYKLTFFDTNVLSRLLHNTTRTLAEKVEIFKNKNIRPVFSLELFAEFLQGLLTSPDQVKHARGKQETIEFLNALNPLWILGHGYISAMEYSHLSQHVNPLEHFKIFSDVALEGHSTNGLVRIYDCDKYFRYKFIPYEASYKYRNNWAKLLSEFQSILPGLAHELKTRITNAYDSTLAVSRSLKTMTKPQRKLAMVQISKFHCNNILKTNTVLSAEDIINNEKELLNLTNQESILQHAPFHTIYDDIYQQHLSDNIHKENDIIDGLFASLSLSYCDYIVTNDKQSGLQELCKKLINKHNLAVQVLEFDADNFYFNQV